MTGDTAPRRSLDSQDTAPNSSPPSHTLGGLNIRDLEEQTAHEKSLSDTSDTADKEDGGQANVNYVHVKVTKPQFIVILVGLCLSIFLGSLDQTIVAPALPKISSDFNALSNASWVGTAYLLTSTALQPLFGKLSDIFGRLAMLLSALAAFLIGSALCGAAQSMTWLIIARAVTGIGGAGAMAMAFIIIADITSLKDRPRYIGLISSMFGLSSVLGPILGGVLTDRATWRWCFYINLPICAVTIISAVIFIRIPTTGDSFKEKIKRIDFVGSILVVGALVMILLALSWGGHEYPWDSARVLALLIVGIFVLGGFVVYEFYIPPEPIVIPAMFKIRNVYITDIVCFLIGMGMMSMIYYIPIYFSVIHNVSAIMSGVHMLPLLCLVTLGAMLGGQFINRFGHIRGVITVGCALSCLGSGLLYLLDNDANLGLQVGLLFIPGFGMGLCMPSTGIMVQAWVTHNLMASAISFLMFMRSIGGVIGLAIANTILTNSLNSHLKPVIAQFPEYEGLAKAAIDNSSVIWQSDVPDDVRSGILEAYAKSLRIVFVVICPYFGVATLLSLFSKKTNLGHNKQEQQQQGEGEADDVDGRVTVEDLPNTQLTSDSNRKESV